MINEKRINELEIEVARLNSIYISAVTGRKEFRAALIESRKEIAILKHEKGEHNIVIIELEQKLEKARECLEYYASVENWVSNSGKIGLGHQIPVMDAELIEEGFAKGQHAAGKRARKCLEEIK